MSQTEKIESDYQPHLALAAVQLFFGLTPVVGKFVLQTIPSVALVGFRVAGAALAFAALQYFSAASLRLEKKSHYAWMALYSLLGVVVNQLLFITGLSLTNAVNTSLLAVLIPIFALIIGAAFGLDKLTRRKVIGVVIAAGGVIYLIDPARASFSSETTQGDLMIIINGFSYAGYLALSKNLIQKYGALKSMAWLFLFGSLFTLPFSVYSLRTVELAEVSNLTWMGVAGIIIFSTFLAYYLNAFALARVSPAIVAVYIYLQPLIGFISAMIFLNEEFNSRLLIAGALILGGLFFVTRSSSAKNPPGHITYP